MFGNGTLVFSKTNTSAITIPAFSAVTQDLAVNDGINLCSTNQRALGISPEYDLTANSVGPIAFGGIVRWILGTGGALRGDRLKSDASGHGVKIATGGTTIQNVTAIAAEAGSADDAIMSQIFLVQEAPGDYLS